MAPLLLVVACGGPQSSPEGTVRYFIDALESKDEAAFQASFTEETLSLVDEIERLSDAAPGSDIQAFDIDDWCQMFCGGTIIGSTLLGDSATVDVRVEGIEERFPLKRQGDIWQIDFTTHLQAAVQMLRITVPEAESEDPLP